MSAYKALSTLLKKPLYDYAMDLGYDESNILILAGDMPDLERNHYQVYQNLLSCKHHSDSRSPLAYGRDLVASWIFEDLLFKGLHNDEFDIELSGADHNRMVLARQNTSTTGDYLVRTHDGREIIMELVNDYTGFWCREQVLHLRDDKYLHLQENRNLLLAIAISPRVQKFTIFDFRQNIPARYIKAHEPWGGKPAYELHVDADSLYDFTYPQVIRRINQLLETL